MKLFEKKVKRIPVALQLNARLQEEHREELFEAGLDGVLRGLGIGEVNGGDTQKERSGEVKSCTVRMLVQKDQIGDLAELLDGVDRIPKGSCLRFDGLELPIGTLEGLGLYLNNTDLPDEVYETCDINELIVRLDELLGGLGRRYSYWESEAETALYYYGAGYDAMRKAIAALLEEEPLCQRCRVVRIA